MESRRAPGVSSISHTDLGDRWAFPGASRATAGRKSRAGLSTPAWSICLHRPQACGLHTASKARTKPAQPLRVMSRLGHSQRPPCWDWQECTTSLCHAPLARCHRACPSHLSGPVHSPTPLEALPAASLHDHLRLPSPSQQRLQRPGPPGMRCASCCRSNVVIIPPWSHRSRAGLESLSLYHCRALQGPVSNDDVGLLDC